MSSYIAEILSAEIQMPSRWVPGEARLVRLRLLNGPTDMTQVEWRAGWVGQGDEGGNWRRHDTLKRQTQTVLEHHLPAPAQSGEDVLRFEVRADAGSHLKLECLGRMEVEVRQRPNSGDIKVEIHNSGIGDKAGYGQIAQAGSGVGHQVHIHGSDPSRIDQWIDEDPHSDQWRDLPLSVRETCLGWPNDSGMELAGIPRGSFKMGASPNDGEARPDEKIVREVHLTRSFWMGVHPVTNEQYTRVTGAPTPVTLAGHQAPHMPVANLTWGQAVDFCARLTDLERAAHTLPAGWHYRLPTEAEWEYACRAGSTTPRYGELNKIGSVVANGGCMMPVGRFEPNAWGIHDMLGLVFEWCQDAYGPYRRSEQADPVRWPEQGKPLHRVVRGGCYQGPDLFARASARYGRDPALASHRIGFRVVLAHQD